ncbi:MAG: SAM-dependent DNA methyltransferase, partial [Richelia sp. RM2_1_2]|nr:SAM-dependent DNA methyltransferase [Richelia sp. RM1_1_1]NJO64749.1 SAM-dependent DNA methyltransferase [Richelia sp. RM2_1_2]
MAETDKIKQDEINSILWNACDTFRGVIDPSEYKNYILVFLFLKYISDIWQDHYEEYQKQYGDDDERILRKMERERFVLPKGASYYDIYEQRNADNIGELINVALEKIEEHP